MVNIPIPQLGYTLEWRNNVLVPYIFERGKGQCWVQGCYYKPRDCHEALITRGDVQGWKPASRRILIFHPVNCIALCQKHHNTELEPNKQDVLDWMVEYYDKDFVYGWLEQIAKEFKVLTPFLKEVLR